MHVFTWSCCHYCKPLARRQLFQTEDALKITEDVTPLFSIYSPSAVIYHGNDTPDTGDDYLECDGIGEVITWY